MIRSAEWRSRAACRGLATSLWFPAVEQSTRTDGDGHAARLVCGGCPVRGECLDYALETRQPFGIWGGLSVRARRQLNRSRTA